MDYYGAPRPFTGTRFVIHVKEHDPRDEPGWTYKLLLTDRAYVDSDGYPIDAIAAGDSWPEAFACAGLFVEDALHSPVCIF